MMIFYLSLFTGDEYFEILMSRIQRAVQTRGGSAMHARHGAVVHAWMPRFPLHIWLVGANSQYRVSGV